MENQMNCIIADVQREVFNNLCKDTWDNKLQSKFGQYAELICNTRPTEDGGETYLTLGIYNTQEELINKTFNRKVHRNFQFKCRCRLERRRK